MVDIIELLSEDGFIKYNKKIGKILGFDASVLLGELCSRHRLYEKEGLLTSDGMFYLTRETIYDDIGMSADYQRTALKKLTNAGIIEVKRVGIPSKNYYRINAEKLCKLLEKSQQNQQSSVSATTGGGSDRQLVGAKTDTIKIINNIYNKKDNIIDTNTIKNTTLSQNTINIKDNNNLGFSNENDYLIYGRLYPSVSFSPTEENSEITDNGGDKVEFPDIHTAILWKQIVKCCTELGITADHSIKCVYNIVLTYHKAYLDRFGIEHRDCSTKSLKRVISAFCGSERVIEDWEDIEMWQDIINQHFKTNYTKECDYSICHFASAGIIRRRFYETCL